MKLIHKQQLKSLQYHEQQYGYVALIDYKQYCHLTLLPKIIRLKKENRKLCAKRKSLEISIITKTYHTGWFSNVVPIVSEITKLSEKIGKNSYKIRKYRSEYCKYSSKWVANKRRGAANKDIPF